MNALQTFLASNYSNALIFEDDVMKTGPFSWQELRALMADLLSLDPLLWDLQYHGSCYSEPLSLHPRGRGLIAAPGEEDVYCTALNAFCLHAVVYSRAAAEVFLTCWMPFREAVDTILSELICKYGEER
jgi:GR25 family glycosyltransferase involved in LPS biosynthesis